MATCYNTMTSACIQNTNSTNIPYVLCHSVKRNPLWSDEDGYNNYYDRLRLYNTVTYDDVNKGLYFGTSTSYASGWTQSTRDTITGNVVNVLSGVYTTSYWFMLKDYAQSTFGSSGKLIFTAFHYTSLGYGHKITDTGFKVQYTQGRAIGGQPYYTTAVSDYTVNYTFNQNVWYHVCVKVDNTAGNGANEGTATTQLWINGVSQSLTANETNRDMNGRFPSFCWFGVVNQASSGTYGHTLGGDGMYGHLISNIKIYIAHDGTDYFERVAIPDYNTGPDFYNEGPPNEGVSISGGVNISGGLRANGSSGTNGQVLTSSGGSAMTWTTPSVFSGDIADYITHTGDPDAKFGFPTTDTFTITLANIERFRINSSGEAMFGSSSGQTMGTGHKMTIVSGSTGSSSSSYADLVITNRNENNKARILLGTPYNQDATSAFKAAIIAEGIGSSSRCNLHFCLENSTDNAANADITDSKMVIKYDTGNVGIGTTSPASTLDVVGTITATTANFTNLLIPSYITHTGDTDTFFGFPNTNTFKIRTAGTDRLRITSTGNVGIGTTTPGAFLDVNGSSTVNSYSSAIRRFFNAGGQNFSGSVGTWGNFSIRASSSIATSGYFVAHSGTWQASDSRIKTNINDVTDASALEKLRLLEPKTYTYIDTNEQGDTTVYGFIAQEVSNVFPEAVKISENVIPNIYELSNVSDSNVITFTNFNTSDLLTSNVTSKIHVKTVYDKVERLTLDEVIDAKSIRVKEDLTNMIGSVDDTGNVVSGNQVFVMGQEVDNFNILKKEYIFTIATAALQEVDRQLQAEKTKVVTLETQVADLLARVTALENN